jgi:hypothetical protein
MVAYVNIHREDSVNGRKRRRVFSLGSQNNASEADLIAPNANTAWRAPSFSFASYLSRWWSSLGVTLHIRAILPGLSSC